MKNKANIFFQESFQVLLSTYLLFIVIETYKEGILSMNINLNYLLVIVAVTGLGMVLTDDKKERKDTTQKHKPDLYILFSLSLLSSVFIYSKTESLENIAVILSIISFLLIFMITYLLLTETPLKK